MLAHLVPAPLVRVFAGRYLAGDNMTAALDTAETLRNREIRTTLDLLGEDVRHDEQVQQNRDVYERLLHAIAHDARFSDRASRPSLSLKPSAFTTGAQEAAFEPIEHLARVAREREVALTIDMEDHRWTDVTLAHAIGLFERGHDVGTVLQSRLHRTEADLARIPAGMRVRLVIGIYPEPAEIAVTDKREMKERLLAFAETLLSRGALVEFATHDEEFVERFARDVAPRFEGRCEVQMLLGVPRTRAIGRLQAGEYGVRLPVRLYVPFAVSWKDATAYLRRRMEESPGIILNVLKNLFAR
jgi:proline dehydrogenase